jgi:alginate O-acetyltransferase complex protein AlgI
MEYLFLFLPGIVAGCVLARKVWGARGAQLLILTASLYFYAQGRPSNLVYLAASILFNWALAKAIVRVPDEHRKNLLRLGLAINILYLCVFKYTQFLIENLPFLDHSILSRFDFSFVLGISFFTVSQIMYLVDCYESLQPANNLIDHATFVSFFPYVISGPLAKAKRIVHQFEHLGTRLPEGDALRARGLYIFSMGLFKKVVLADSLGLAVNVGFTSPLHHSALDAWAFALGYMLQIYFDFSGYTDMAMGSAFMLGIEIPRNFDIPLRSKSLIEFWERWHISLSSFIFAYIYTPLLKSFSRATLITASISTLLSMSIAGLWHGPSWTFALWGTLHGLGLAVNQYWRRKRMPKLPIFFSWMLTFCFVTVVEIFFRAPTVSVGMALVRALVDPQHPFDTQVLVEALRALNPVSILYIVPISLSAFVAFGGKSSDQLARDFEPTVLNSIAVTAMVLISLFYMNVNPAQTFVYFKF